MKKRRIMALLLSCALIVGSLLSGCGQQEQKKPGPSQESKTSAVTSKVEESSTEEVKELEPYTVTMWMIATAAADDEKVLEAVNARIQETLPNTTLEIVKIASAEYKDRWNKAMASGEKIDMAWSASNINNPIIDVENEVLIPVDELLETYGQGIVDAVGGWDMLDINRINGNIYHILSWQGLVGNRKVFMMNKQLETVMPSGWLADAQEVFLANQEYTIDAKLAMLDKIEEVLAVAKEQGIGTEGMNKGALSDVLYPGVVYNDGYRVFVTEKDGVFTVQSWFDNPVYKAYADKLNEFWKEGYYRKDIMLLDNSGVKQTEDHTVWITNGVAENYAETLSVSQGSEQVGCLMMPYNQLTTGFGTGMVFPKSGKNPERTMQVLNLIYTDAELYQLLVYGIEGTHYTANADGTITRPASDERTYKGITNWRIGSCINSLPESTAKIGYYEGLLKAQEDAVVPPLLGFTFSAGDADVAAEQSNISATITEYDWSFFTEDYENRYAEFCDKLEAAGMDAYMKAFKEALTKYVTENNLGTVAP